MYDPIGDIRGHAAELEKLLTKMDYREIDGVRQRCRALKLNMDRSVNLLWKNF